MNYSCVIKKIDTDLYGFEKRLIKNSENNCGKMQFFEKLFLLLHPDSFITNKTKQNK